MRLQRLNGAAILVAGHVAMMTAAAAQESVKVGQAEIIRNEVVNVGEAQLIPISIGDVVVRDEVVRTSADSDARIGLIDNTKLTLGPGSTLKIDRAVYSGETSYKQITIRLTSGAFRFITGHSDKKSYKIETPYASIGVRGTILDIQVLPNQTLVTLQDGQASVCAGTQCTQLLQRGHTANVLREGGGTQIKRELTPSWTFASVCGGNAALCTPLPVQNALGKTGLTKAAKNAITRFCPDGRPMSGSTCAASQNAAGNATLPLLNGALRDAALPSSTGPLSPSTALPSDRVGADLPQVSPQINPQVNPSSSRLSLPSLRR